MSWWLPVFMLVACGEPGSLSLSDGSEVRLGEGTEVVLVVDGRETFALSAMQGPQLRSFEQTSSGELAIWDFERINESGIALNTRGRASLEADEVRVPFTASPDADAPSAELVVRPDGEGRTRFTLNASAPSNSIAIPVRCDAESTFFGFGEQYSKAEHRGNSFDLFVQEQGIGRDGTLRPVTGDDYTSSFPMPYWLDARGFGVLFETDFRSVVDLCDTRDGVAWIEVEQGESLSWWVFHGPDPLDVIRQLGEVVGRPAVPPDWAHGTWLCMQGGTDAVMAQVATVEAQELPVSVLWVQDWTGRARNVDGGYGVKYRWVPDEEELYPDFAGVVRTLHDKGFRVVVYANPFVSVDLDGHFPEMDAQGLLPIDPSTGESYVFRGPRGEVSNPDFTNPAAEAYVQEALRSAVQTYDVDGWMADFSEWQPLDAELHSGADPIAAHNRYPEAWQRQTREVMDELRPDGDWLMFARAGFTGTQAVAQVHWAGDQDADWEVEDGLPAVVPAMLTLSMSGQPFVTHDIAGFSRGPSDEELYLRWTELGAFSPFMRTHDGAKRDDNWRWDEDEATLAFFGRMARIHEVLAPELQALAAQAGATGAPLVRHLVLHYPEDAEVYGIHDQYLLGEELLVAPVLTQGATSRRLYLPEGTWFDVWTGAELSGGQWVDHPAPLGSPPVFSRGADRTDLRSVE